MRIITVLLLLFIAGPSVCQEKVLRSGNEIVSKPQDPAKVVAKTIKALQNIKNAECIKKEQVTIPYLPAVFHEPFIGKEIISVDRADTIQGAKLIYYVLEDTFRLQTVYDGKYVARVNDGKTYIGDLSNNPRRAQGMIGSFHMRVKTWLEHALKEKAEIQITEANDSLKIELAFHNLQVEFGAGGGTRIRKDTLGFVSRYTVYIDKHTYLPVKAVRQMPYNTSIETILYQKINAVDTLVISTHDAVKRDSSKVDQSPLSDDSPERRLKGIPVADWKLKEVEGDTIRFSDLKGRKCLMVFNSIGWRPCVQAIPFLKQLRNEYPVHDLAVVSIEPFINYAGVLKDYKLKHDMNYPLLLADTAIKKHYAISEVPVWMIIDKHGVITKVITGFRGKDTEEAIRNAISQR